MELVRWDSLGLLLEHHRDLPLPTSQEPNGLPGFQKLESLRPLKLLWMLVRAGWLDEIMPRWP